MRTIKEAQAANQAREIFNNSKDDIIEHFVEECDELKHELYMNNPIERKIDEAADVAYMFNQICNLLNTDYNSLLKYAIEKNEKKRK